MDAPDLLDGAVGWDGSSRVIAKRCQDCADDQEYDQGFLQPADRFLFDWFADPAVNARPQV